MNSYQWYSQVNEKISEDPKEFYERRYQETLMPAGKGYRLQPCPKCGHSDCCSVSEFVKCFSCGLSGSHTSVYYEYAVNEGKSASEIRKDLAEFAGIPQYANMTKEEVEEREHKERIDSIRMSAALYYHEVLMNSQSQYTWRNRDGENVVLTPIQYQIEIRKHDTLTLGAFKVGFVENYTLLKETLMSRGYDREEISEAKVWFPEGTFLYASFNPYTHEVERLNIKNPFNATDQDGNVIPGQSSGDRVLSFSPAFNFRKNTILVEGENDALTVYEELDKYNEGKPEREQFKNIVWLAGNPSDEVLMRLRDVQGAIYVCTDNDAAGQAYIDRIDSIVPDRDLFHVSFSEEINDIDDYYKRSGYDPDTIQSIETLLANATPITTTHYHIEQTDGVWTIANRHKQLTFKPENKVKGTLIGQIDLFENGILIDREVDKSLDKCKKDKKPFNYYLADYLYKYYNNGLEDKNIDELLDIVKYCENQGKIIRLLAEKLNEFENENDVEKKAVDIVYKTNSGFRDSVLKELNNLRAKEALDEVLFFQPVRISLHFDPSADRGYVYFNARVETEKAIKELPFLIRNDKTLIRLDLIEQQDEQSLLIFDKKYRLPYEITKTVVPTHICSLQERWVRKWRDNEIHVQELLPYNLAMQIEEGLKKFYYFKNEDVYKIITMWIMLTYYYPLFPYFPYLFINGEKNSGKSHLDKTIALFAYNCEYALNASTAALYRMIAHRGGTYILDEIENLDSMSKAQNNDLATVLKGGFMAGTRVFRQNMDKDDQDAFEVFGPKVISNIYGLEEVTESRCIKIKSYRIPPSHSSSFANPEEYFSNMDKMGEIKEITSKCAISSLENFKYLNNLFHENTFSLESARLKDLIKPLYVMSLFCDISQGLNDMSEFEERKAELSMEDLMRGHFTSGFLRYHENFIKTEKAENEEMSVEGIVRAAAKEVALELTDAKDGEPIYTDPNKHKYKEPIPYDISQGWFEINSMHFKCFVEENDIGEMIPQRRLNKVVKTSFNFEADDIKRRIINIEDNPSLMQEYNNNPKPKVSFFRFYFKDYIDVRDEWIERAKSTSYTAHSEPSTPVTDDDAF